MRAFLIFFLVAFPGINSFCQNAEIVVGNSYFGTTINEKEICDRVAFTTRPEVTMAVENIVKRSGLKQNFYVMECPNTDNCFAATRNGERLIVYDARFFNRLNTVTRTDWAALSILAHEIGHHLQGHTIKSGGSDHNRELEADEFSGFVMYQMGATLAEAQSAIQSVTTEYATSSHPPRSVRLKAIETGYTNARELYPGVTAATDAPVTVAKEMKTGCIAGNCTEGRGTAINSRTFERYEGDWHLGKRHGYGREFSEDGQLTYIGGFETGKYSGNGILFLSNGDRYEGGFRNGKMHGKNSRYIFRNGDILTINYDQGLRQGFGILTRNSGEQSNTYFKNDRRIH
ncbi:MORN repeat-containing protein [Leadbetterella sp. DM7]|uniref:MORN repeat-containing protein n=1 Tax=Leadbetterella sp. DM7 TaxID=3235085 RepID=UPI00349ECB09